MKTYLPPLPRVPMQRIIFHWTAGTHKANDTDRKAYHFLIEGDGGVVKGVAGIERNSVSLKDGYAAHTLNCNTGSIGVSLCSMAGAVESPYNPGKYPITPAQWRTLAKVISELCVAYDIPVTPKTVLSHAEVQKNLGITQRNKWDIARLPFGSRQTAMSIGDEMRRMVYAEIDGNPVMEDPHEPIPPVKDPVPEGAQAVVATNGSNLIMRAVPHGDPLPGNGLPNGTPLEVLTTMPDWLHVRTPYGIIGYVSRQWVKVVDGPAPLEPTKPAVPEPTPSVPLPVAAVGFFALVAAIVYGVLKSIGVF